MNSNALSRAAPTTVDRCAVSGAPGILTLLGTMACARPLPARFKEWPRPVLPKSEVAEFPPGSANGEKTPANATPALALRELKKLPLRSCPSSAKVSTLVEKLPGFEVKLKPFALLPDQLTVTWFSTNSPANGSMAAPFWTLRRRVTGPLQTASKETVASISGPSASALGKVKYSSTERFCTCISAFPAAKLT